MDVTCVKYEQNKKGKTDFPGLAMDMVLPYLSSD